MNLETFSLKVVDPKVPRMWLLILLCFGRALFFLFFGRRLLIGSDVEGSMATSMYCTSGWFTSFLILTGVAIVLSSAVVVAFETVFSVFCSCSCCHCCCLDQCLICKNVFLLFSKI